MSIISGMLICPLTDHSGGWLLALLQIHLISHGLRLNAEHCIHWGAKLMQIKCIYLVYCACTDLKRDKSTYFWYLENYLCNDCFDDMNMNSLLH